MVMTNPRRLQRDASADTIVITARLHRDYIIVIQKATPARARRAPLYYRDSNIRLSWWNFVALGNVFIHDNNDEMIACSNGLI
jgi:hypothetical protein